MNFLTTEQMQEMMKQYSKPTTLEDWAVSAVRRGWYVFPCHPRSKSPATEHGFKDASNDETVVRQWWAKNLNYNPAIDLGRSNLVVVDFDTAKPLGIEPPTYTVRTGRNPKDGIDGIQMYYTGSCKTRNMYRDANGNPSINDKDKKIGEVRSRGAYVMAAGCIHPSGNPYVVINDVPLAVSPEQNEAAPIKTGVAIGTDEQNEIAEYVEAAFDEAGINYLSRQNYKDVEGGGFVWHIICPWDELHSVHKREPDTSSSVIMYDTGKLIYECKHRCLNVRQWKELRAWMEEKVGHRLVFGKLSDIALTQNSSGLVSNYEEPKNETTTTTPPIADTPADGTILLIFPTAVNASLAVAAGYNAIDVHDAPSHDLNQYDIVVLFGQSDLYETIRSTVGWAIQYFDLKTITAESLRDLLSMDAIKLSSRRNPTWHVVVSVPNPHLPVTDNLLVMPDSAMASTILGDLYGGLFLPNGFPLGVALPALVTAASVRVPMWTSLPDVSLDPEQLQEEKKSMILASDDPMVNLYTAIVAPVHGGKSQVIEWGCKALNIYQEEQGPRYLEGKFGSPEMMLKNLKKNLPNLKEGILINPDEWAFLFTKAGVPNSSFTTFMTTSFYRRKQLFEVGNRVGEVRLNNSLSFIGGIVEENFDAVFGAESLGGLYDRFLFGYHPGWKWSYRPFPRPTVATDNGWNPVPVKVDASVYEVIADWNKRSGGLGRAVEICTRIATIYASIDGRPVLYGQDLERLQGLAANQAALRAKFRPNEGENPDAQFANAACNWLETHTKGEWVAISQLKEGIHAYEKKLGPNVAERALAAMSRSSRIEVWLPQVINRQTGEENAVPSDWRGRRPKLGLVRKCNVSR